MATPICEQGATCGLSAKALWFNTPNSPGTWYCELHVPRADAHHSAQDAILTAQGPEVARGHPAPATVDVASIREGHREITREIRFGGDTPPDTVSWTASFDPPICAECREPWGTDGCTVVRLCDALESAAEWIRANPPIYPPCGPEPIRCDDCPAWAFTRPEDGPDIFLDLTDPAQHAEGCEWARLASLAASRGGSGAAAVLWGPPSPDPTHPGPAVRFGMANGAVVPDEGAGS